MWSLETRIQILSAVQVVHDTVQLNLLHRRLDYLTDWPCCSRVAPVSAAETHACSRCPRCRSASR
ncbi:unnamed protein product [Chondrus crispus]|uniref:Uncharacterized protein n=1 Tax=Chondrus crispus TaxID=2769 RepID=R7QGG4_CHOCR|nr:unnamed protein product [Chondrus crispus]CDF36536.1 unnamed protein product [Chondrus crispus]|eukprot:XP_005716355.1 unnamed protein product [Chondrus crispus]